MKILISLASNHRPLEAGTVGLIRSKRMRPATWPSANSSSTRLTAVPSAAQEEDRSDMVSADHHGGHILSLAIVFGKVIDHAPACPGLPRSRYRQQKTWMAGPSLAMTDRICASPARFI
jgi:hypothetical protein